MANNMISFNEHGELLNYWVKKQYQNEFVIYFDQHLDFKKISEENLKILKSYSEKNQNMNELNRDVPFREYETYPYGLDNFLYAAKELNIIDHLIWVYPNNDYTINDLQKVLITNVSLIAGFKEEVLSSFAINEYSVELSVNHLKIEITNLKYLSHIKLNKTPLIDIDLDFFYNSNKQQLHLVKEFKEYFLSLGKAWKDDPTMTYSITSGFLPEKYSYLGEQIADFFEMDIVHHSKLRTESNSITKISYLLNNNSTYLTSEIIEEVWEKVLVFYSGTGLGVKSLLFSRIGNLELAIQYYDLAKQNNVNYFWSAYNIGLIYMNQKRYALASHWFLLAEGNLTDSIQTHSLILRSICELKQGNFSESLALGIKCADEIGIRAEPYLIIALSCKELGLIREYKKNYVLYKTFKSDGLSGVKC
ncbi:tetratricopeptide repeat protein [Paenibacillus sp. GCM10012307]|uniref:Tetratricopeptide repeat protein n=1 Tax=Paenibacillus roseus TaxID=2798579 RepID=A0A934J7T6_9BACL|nr:hypothetical protein [Paenibacillus roseus]MBJ6363198.1 hypothetical protein [Paenibacillus roseus]